MACPACGGEGQRRPSGDYVCGTCGAMWRETQKPAEVPKP